VIKSISFIVLTQFFHFNELKILRQPGYLFFQVKPTIFFLQCNLHNRKWFQPIAGAHLFMHPFFCINFIKLTNWKVLCCSFIKYLLSQSITFFVKCVACHLSVVHRFLFRQLTFSFNDLTTQEGHYFYYTGHILNGWFLKQFYWTHVKYIIKKIINVTLNYTIAYISFIFYFIKNNLKTQMTI